MDKVSTARSSPSFSVTTPSGHRTRDKAAQARPAFRCAGFAGGREWYSCRCPCKAGKVPSEVESPRCSRLRAWEKTRRTVCGRPPRGTPPSGDTCLGSGYGGGAAWRGAKKRSCRIAPARPGMKLASATRTRCRSYSRFGRVRAPSVANTFRPRPTRGP